MAKGATAANAKNSKPSAAHPPYFQMVCEALNSLKERTGSSQPAIAKFIEEKYCDSLPANFRKHLSMQLKNCVDSEKLVKVKNSFKIAAPGKAQKAAGKASPEPAKAKLKATASPKRKAARKVAAKAQKMKRLSQVKTPEALKQKKMTKKVVAKVAAGSTAGAKKAKKSDAAKEQKASAPAKRKSSRSEGPAAKKAKK